VHDNERDAVHDAERDAVHDAERDAVNDTEHDALRTAMRQPTTGAGAQCLREAPPERRPQTWLARVGWRRYGLLRLDEAPAGAPRTGRELTK
jgi:hypothetical protein